MTKEHRFEEVLAAMTSFRKNRYQKSELLNEMLALQQEIVDITFADKEISKTGLRIWDVERHLVKLNQECGNVADKELQKFEEESKKFCNLIKAEISGNKGEAKALKKLESIRSKNVLLKNVELSDGERRTELDAIVITTSGVTIVEIKNSSKDIFIDEIGDYYRTGEFLRRDYNIADKMSLKKELLRKALGERGQDIQIRSILVFTDNRIEIQNRYTDIRTCFVSQLPYIIDGIRNCHNLTEEDMVYFEGQIRNAECKESYPFAFDVDQYKQDFATLLITLENATANVAETSYEEEVVEEDVVATDAHVDAEGVEDTVVVVALHAYPVDAVCVVGTEGSEVAAGVAS